VTGVPDGARIHGSGGGGLGVALFVGAALAVKLARPVVAATGELVHVLVIVAVVIVGAGAVCVGGLLAWRWRRLRLDAARTAPPAFARRRWCGPPRRSRRSGKHLS
jgi:hypothetical protein